MPSWWGTGACAGGAPPGAAPHSIAEGGPFSAPITSPLPEGGRLFHPPPLPGAHHANPGEQRAFQEIGSLLALQVGDRGPSKRHLPIPGPGPAGVSAW